MICVTNVSLLNLNGDLQTVSTVMTILFILMHRPDVQQRVQDEINSVIDQERLPAFDDRKDLPYLEAVMKECSRYLGFFLPDIDQAHNHDP